VVIIETKKGYLRLTSSQLNASSVGLFCICGGPRFERFERLDQVSRLCIDGVDDVWIALLELVVQPVEPLRDYCRPVSVASVKGLERHIMALGLAHKFPQFRDSSVK
jgi:hypothetical protein